MLTILLITLAWRKRRELRPLLTEKRSEWLSKIRTLPTLRSRRCNSV